MVPHAIGQPGQSHTCEIRVRYAETDAMGLLHHAKYWEYFEHVRTELLRANGFRYRDLEREGVFFVVYKAACKYLAPIGYDELVHVTATVQRITRTRVDHAYIITRGETDIAQGQKRLCEASSTLACVGKDGKPRLMPDALWETVAEESS